MIEDAFLPANAGDTRETALKAAVALHLRLGDVGHRAGDHWASTTADAELRILGTADRFAAWLGGPTRIRFKIGPVVPKGWPVPECPDYEREGTAMQMNTGQQFSVVADTEDAAGYDTTEQVDWSISDEAVASLRISGDRRTVTVVSGAPGSAVLTATLPGLGLSATLAVDVVPAGTATIRLEPSDPVEETPAEPVEPPVE